ncbi:MAG: hypothetical protein NW226_14005 [Microscillaceae bacterium]|nr:hypothetical protein [Microscillaceae bacterium]
MNLEHEFEELRKRVDMLEIRLNEKDVKESRTEVLLERLLEVARIQAGHSESMNKSLQSIQKDVSEFKDETRSCLKGLEDQVSKMIDYLKNPPKNGH